VPTLFEALLRLPGTEKMDLSPLRGVFSGGDTLPPDLKRRTDEFLRKRGAKIEVREGYGLTECVTACCLTPESGAPEGSIGKPYPGTLMKIVAVDTTEKLPPGKDGEICIAGPSVMPCYDNDPGETAETLRLHDDGLVWLHTGDLGMIDGDGFVFFRGRLKRMIITSGHNVYPFHVESALCANKFVARACVVGVADDYRMQRVKAYIVPSEDAPGEEALAELLREHCRVSLAPQNRPREYEFIAALPITKLGKVDYRKLQSEVK
jgi:long-chain acyl-CoA synthetase